MSANGYRALMWQPIETAPKDGTKVLIFGKAGGDWESFDDASGMAVASFHDGYWCGYYSGLEPIHKPTHWMPLPAAPE